MNKYITLLKKIAPFLLSAFCLMMGIRIFEFNTFPEGIIHYQSSYLFQGLLLDFLFLLNVTGIIVILTLPFLILSNLLPRIIFHLLLLIVVFFQFGISYYFALSQTPLDESIFYLNWRDLLAVVDLKHYLNISILSMVSFAITCYYFLGKLFQKLKLKPWIIISFLVIGLLTIPINFYTSSKNDKTICVNNRINYFIHSALVFANKTKDFKGEIEPNDFAELNPHFYPTNVENKDFPFFHTLANSDDFSQNFNLDKTTPPNIVFIIVESLNSYFVGEQPHEMVQLMPFLSDLSKKSLYFKNTLSTCERTFNVLPTTMAALPIAPERNSAMTINPMPTQFGLPNLLKDHYYSRFYCGLYLSFTNMNGYMNFLNTDYLIDQWEPKYKKRNKEFFCDGDVFNQSFDDELKHPTKKRKLDVFLTYNTHEPFFYPQKNYYKKRVLSLVKNAKLSKERIQHLSKNAVKFGSYAYLDDQLKLYFKQESRKKEHQNTIYFIVGDHGSELCLFDNLARFHTSLLVYSPLLKKAKVSQEIVSQLDIAPSIIGLLKSYPKLNLPEKVAFNGKPLKISNTLTRNHFQVFKGNNTNLLAAIYGKYYYDRGQLYTYSTDLKLKEIHNKTITKKIQKQLELYNKMSSYIFYQNKLIPPIYASKFIKNHLLKPFFSHNFNTAASTFKKEEYTPIEKCPKIPLKTELVSINVEFEIATKKEIAYDDLPELIVTFYSNNKSDYYSGFRAVPTSAKRVNNKMNLVYKAAIQIKDFKYTKNSNIDYYIFNSKKKEYKHLTTSINIAVNR